MITRSWFIAVALLSAGLAAAEEPKAGPGAPVAEGPPAVVAPPAPPPPPPVVKEPVTGMELVHVPGGCFSMGDIYDDGVSGAGDGQDEKPVHEVCVGAFYLGKFEVTQGQWKAVMGKNPSSDNVCRADDCPVDNVTLAEVRKFIGQVNAKGGATFRLPTEAEWEYAARSGGKAERYAGGNDVDAVSWYEANSGYRVNPEAPLAHPVGTKLPNGLGLYNMSGNVYEMTSDWYGATYYSVSPRDNPTGPATGDVHVKRGGCASGHPGNSRTARRSQGDGPDALTGFRLVRVP